ncbi:hypothetical protein ACTHGN_001137 [Pseudomonas putida]|uniref:Integrase n=1 Tax=Pseudomonas mosselii TaxID=78327 RepID=A0A5R8ZID2_9PSED|nr:MULTISPECIES: hypothetical protein [Pseudomonas putida group]TLP65184.1 hypothetical protein FEM01_03130 [Pseudomonas mosselii]
MEHPFILFPIFPPYKHWFPKSAQAFPANRNVNAHMEAIDPRAQPFMSAWYCNEYLTWRGFVHMDEQVYSVMTRSLETMLLWSFSQKISLLDWDESHVDSYAMFCAQPPESWTSSAPHQKYAELPHTPFYDWQINQEWRPFKRSVCDTGDVGEIVATSHNRRINCAREFFGFYHSMTMSARPNPVSRRMHAPPKLPKNHGLPTFTDHQMDWLFKFALEDGLQSDKALEIGVLMSFARWTDFPPATVIGTYQNSSSLAQFTRSNNGQWLFSPDAALGPGDSFCMPMAFTPIFDGYLRSIGVDPISELPTTPLFPKAEGGDGYQADTILRHLYRFRRAASSAARECCDVEIQKIAAQIGDLSYRMMRRSGLQPPCRLRYRDI